MEPCDRNNGTRRTPAVDVAQISIQEREENRSRGWVVSSFGLFDRLVEFHRCLGSTQGSYCFLVIFFSSLQKQNKNGITKCCPAAEHYCRWMYGQMVLVQRDMSDVQLRSRRGGRQEQIGARSRHCWTKAVAKRQAATAAATRIGAKSGQLPTCRKKRRELP